MTNGEKFKTAEERKAAWGEYCKKHYSEDKKCSECPLWTHGECRFHWLDFEYEEELKPCPFCGGEARIIDLEDPEYKYYQIRCSKCMCKTESHLGMEETIAAWNRRVE